MSTMEKIFEKSLLYDFYGELLTDHQKEVYGEYIHEDLSVTELSQILGISRQGAHDMVRRCDRILHGYEEKLHLVAHFLQIKKMVSEVREIALRAAAADSSEQVRSSMDRIVKLSEDILEEY